MRTFIVNSSAPKFLSIRPSANPYDAKSFKNMWSSRDLILQRAEITKVHKFDLLYPM